MAHSSWGIAHKHFCDEVLPILHYYTNELNKYVQSGDILALDISALWWMLYRSFDPLTAQNLEEKLLEFKEREETKDDLA